MRSIVFAVAGLCWAAASGAQINKGHSGAWFNPQTPGQGFLIEVLPGDQVFVAWFTFAASEGKIGAPEQRWLTGQGPIDGDSATLTLSNTSGGVFDTPGTVETVPVGTATLTLPDCTSGLFEYALDEGLSGSFELVRVSTGSVCQNIVNPPRKSVTITHLSNEGVHITDGDQAVVIDGLTRNTQGWIALPNNQLTSLEQGSGNFSGIDVAMVTHNHGDHMTFSSIDPFLAANPQAQLIGPGSMINGVAAQNQTVRVSLQRFTNERVEVNGIPITVFSTRHFDQFGNDFSSVVNFAYLVEIGGWRILHAGDIDYARDNFEAMGLADIGVDAVILPTFNTLISQANFDLLRELLNPATIIAAHFQASAAASEANQVLGIEPDAVVFDEALDSFVLEEPEQTANR